MKKIILLLSIFLIQSSVTANELQLKDDNNISAQVAEEKLLINDIDEENDIYNNPDAVLLDFKNSKTNKLNIKKQEKVDSKKQEYNHANNFQTSLQDSQYYNNPDIYSPKSTSYSKEKNFKNMTFGAKYDNSFTPDTFNQSRTLFSKYKINRFTLNTSYKNSELTSFGQQFKGIFSFSPEYKINDKMSFQSIYSRNIADRSNKNEVIFTLKPFKDDRMDFNVGAGQIYYEDATPTRSQFNFSTKFKF